MKCPEQEIQNVWGRSMLACCWANTPGLNWFYSFRCKHVIIFTMFIDVEMKMRRSVMGPNNNDHNIKNVHSCPFVLCCHNLRGSICYPQLSASKILDYIFRIWFGVSVPSSTFASFDSESQQCSVIVLSVLCNLRENLLKLNKTRSLKSRDKSS